MSSLPGLEADATAAVEIARVGLSAYLLHQAEAWAGNVDVIDGEPHYDGDPDQARYYIALAAAAARLEVDLLNLLEEAELETVSWKDEVSGNLTSGYIATSAKTGRVIYPTLAALVAGIKEATVGTD